MRTAHRGGVIDRNRIRMQASDRVRALGGRRAPASRVDQRTATAVREFREFSGTIKIRLLVRTAKVQVKYAARESNPQPAD
jgi:hypothetical protein